MRLFLAGIVILATSCGGGGGSGGGGSPAMPPGVPSTPSPAPSAQMSPTPSASSALADWDSFGYDLERSGYNPIEKTIGASNVDRLQRLWPASVNVGSTAVREPVLASGIAIAGQPTNVLYAGSNWGSAMTAINAETGAIVWRKSVPSSAYACGAGPASQFSISAAPAIDKAKSRIYFGDGQNGVHAMDLATGAEAAGWPVTIASYASTDHNFIHGGLTYNPANGLLYVVTSSVCDVSPWHGRIVAINTSTPAIVGTFYTTSSTSTPGTSGGGIWGPGGASIDPATNDVYVATGNSDIDDPSNNGSQTIGYSEQVIALSPNLAVIAHNYPTNIPSVIHDYDYDFGSTPLLFQPQGCPPLLAAINKSGMFELYNRANIGGGPIQGVQMSTSTDVGNFIGTPAFDPVTNYVYVGLPSTYGKYAPGLAAFSMQPNCTLNPTPVWSAVFGLDGATSTLQTKRSPITIANGVIYVSNNSGQTEFAFDATSGAQLWTVGLSGYGVQGTVVANGRVYVMSDDGTITAYALPGASSASHVRQTLPGRNPTPKPFHT